MRKLMTIVFLVSLFFGLMWLIPQCATRAIILPHDISGVYIGMSKRDATQRLQEIAVFERDERKRQQVWKSKNDSHFSGLAVGYDEKEQVQYITAFADKETAKERIRFADVGNLSKAKAEIVAPHYRYIWDVAEADEKPAYQVNIYGDNSEFVTIYSLIGKVSSGESEEEEERED